MATESTTTVPLTSLERYIDRLSQPRAITAIGLAFVLLLFGASYLDSNLAGLSDHRDLLQLLGYPVLIVYTLFVSRILTPFTDRAIEAFRPLVSMDDRGFDRLVTETSQQGRRREWVALAAGALFGVLINPPWTWQGEAFWTHVQVLLASVFLFGLLGWLIHGSLADTRLFGELHRQPLAINVFDPTPLEPIAQMSLATSVAFIVGATLSLLMFYSDPRQVLTPQGIMIYGSLILTPVLVFFLNMMSTHRVMADAKELELQLVRHNLSAMYQELKERTDKAQLQDMEAFSDAINAWLAYQKVIEDAPEWPYTTDMLRNLVASTLLPLAAWAAQMIVEFIT
ncbi:MAG: hypothetical protein ACE5F6_08305 [Anaerolineae bacterium]